jgi:hypothetical protein
LRRRLISKPAPGDVQQRPCISILGIEGQCVLRALAYDSPVLAR